MQATRQRPTDCSEQAQLPRQCDRMQTVGLMPTYHSAGLSFPPCAGYHCSGRSGMGRRCCRIYSTPSYRSQSSTSAIQVSSLSLLPSALTVLMPSCLLSLMMSERSSTRQWACSAETMEAFPCRPQGAQARWSSLNGRPSRTSWSITC